MKTTKEEYQFIEKNKQKSLSEIALLLGKYPSLNKEFIINQINGIQKATNKLPEFASKKEIVYPSPLSLEQCSSEVAAIFKSNLVSGISLLDLTGGLGVDAYFFSKKFKEITYVEQQESLFEIATANFNVLKANITAICSSAENFLATNQEQFDVIYIDPARRNQSQKVFQLEDCSPPVLEMLPKLFTISSTVLIKTSPMLDIKKAIQQLKCVERVFVFSIKNECKEVLYLLQKNATDILEISTINISESEQHFNFNFSDEENLSVRFSDPQSYLYEPNASILKAGGFKSIANTFSLSKIASNSHLYTSKKHISNFPGRSFKINNVLPYQANQFKLLGITKANVSCRNFKENVETVRKKLKLKDGGNIFIFATTTIENKPILCIAEKVDL
ncbi:MAG: class I SAM-dependent methyltransferase [Vicingaceae bacterium]|nr:class I SAM-dependent methyltransferase [Vicingaceae bacterium]